MKNIKLVWVGAKEALTKATINIKTTIAGTSLICLSIIAFFYFGLFLGSKGTSSAFNYLQLILAWPTLSFIGLIIFISKFQDSIIQFLSEHTLSKFGAMEWGKKQKQAEEGPEPSPKVPGISTAERNDEETGKSELEQLRAEMEQTKQFAFLDKFLVEQTKKVLLWFYSTTYGKNPVPKIVFDSTYQFFIPDPSQRATILDVLQKNDLITSKDGINYIATGKADLFLKHIGLVAK